MSAQLSPDYWINQQKATKTKHMWELYKTLSHQVKELYFLKVRLSKL